jgi:hypothetical protein
MTADSTHDDDRQHGNEHHRDLDATVLASRWRG